MDLTTPISIVGLVAQLIVIVGLFLAVEQLVDQNRQQHREFESLYVQRYWAIIDRFSADVVLRDRRDGLSESDLLACRAYLQLCEDEVDLFEAGRITKETWAIWKSGIDYTLAGDLYLALLKESKATAYPSLRRYMESGILLPRYRGTKAALRGL